MWRMTSADGKRWVQWMQPGVIAASDPQLGTLVSPADAPIEVAPMTGQQYRPVSRRDPVAVLLLARRVLGAGAAVTGDAPKAPAVNVPSASGRVY